MSYNKLGKVSYRARDNIDHIGIIDNDGTTIITIDDCKVGSVKFPTLIQWINAIDETRQTINQITRTSLFAQSSTTSNQLCDNIVNKYYNSNDTSFIPAFEIDNEDHEYYEDHSDEDHSDEDHSDEDHSDEDHSDEDHSDEDHPDEDHSDEDHSNEDHSNEDHPVEDYLFGMESIYQPHDNDITQFIISLQNTNLNMD
jgi:hypothetical protein